MCELAEAQGIKLNYDDPEELVKQLSKVYDPYRLARNIALRLCDADGNNLFDFENMDDLEALSSLDKSVSEELSRALMVEEPNFTARRKFQLILSLALGKTLAEIEAKCLNRISKNICCFMKSSLLDYGVKIIVRYKFHIF